MVRPISKQEAYSLPKLDEDLVKYINGLLEDYDGTSVVIREGMLESFVLNYNEYQMELVVQSYTVFGWTIEYKNKRWYFS